MEKKQVGPKSEGSKRQNRPSRKQSHSRTAELEEALKSLQVENRQFRARTDKLAADVRELTAELARVRPALEMEIQQRCSAETHMAALEGQFAEALSGMSRLHEISTLLASHGTLQELLDQMMDTAISVTAADKGTLQLLDGESGTLKIAAQRGFDPPFCDFFESVDHGVAACGTALQHQQRVIVEQVTESPIFAGTPALAVLLAAGVRAVQSTPLFSRSGELMGMCSTHYRTPHRPTDSQLRLLDLLLRQAADLIKQVEAEEGLRRAGNELRALAASLQQAREEERKLLAREIHDELSGTLTALRMDLSALPDRLARDRGLFVEKLHSMSELIDRSLERVQSIVSGLRPVVLDKFGLIAAMEWQIREFHERSGILCESRLPAEEITLDSDRSTAVFRIFQEALTNVARHANASVVSVELRSLGDSLILDVRDNGRGIDGTKVFNPASIGLLGMRERALSFGGVMEIHRLPERGTLVRAVFPVRSTKAGCP